MGSWSMTNTETIFFTLGNITCFLELMEKYSGDETEVRSDVTMFLSKLKEADAIV